MKVRHETIADKALTALQHLERARDLRTKLSEELDQMAQIAEQLTRQTHGEAYGQAHTFQEYINCERGQLSTVHLDDLHYPLEQLRKHSD